MRWSPLLLACCFWTCTSPQSQLADLKSDMLNLLGNAAGWEMKLPGGSLWLPLPPPLEVQATQRVQALKLLRQATEIDTTTLETTARQQLRQYRQALLDLTNVQTGWPVDPMLYTLRMPLEHCQADPSGANLVALLEQVPAYYATVEERWEVTNTRQLTAAIQQSIRTLEQIEEWGKQGDHYIPDVQIRLRAALPAVSAAVKNYLARCRSAVLEEGLIKVD